MALVARWPVRRSAILVLSYYPSRVRITFLRALSCGLVLNDFTVNWVGCGFGSRQSSVVVAGLESGVWVALWMLGLWGLIGLLSSLWFFQCLRYSNPTPAAERVLARPGLACVSASTP